MIKIESMTEENSIKFFKCRKLKIFLKDVTLLKPFLDIKRNCCNCNIIIFS